MMTTPPETQSRSRWKLYFYTIAVNLLYMSAGCVMTWASYSVPLLQSQGLVSSQSAASWLSSILAVGAAIGPLSVGATLHLLGRLPILQFVALLYLLSWLILGFPSCFSLLILGRVLGGVATGATFTIVSIYLCEVADEKTRQMLGSVNEISIGIGYLIEYWVGPYISYWSLLAFSAIPAFLFILVSILLPESPYHIASKSTEKAIQVLANIRNLPPDSPKLQEEILSIQNYLASQQGRSSTGNLVTNRRQNIKSVFIALYVVTAVQLSGISVFQNYAHTIFESAHSSEMGPVWFALIGILFSFFAPLVRFIGLKWMYISTGLGMAFCLLGVAVYFYFLEYNYITLQWQTSIPIVLLTLLNGFFSMGSAPMSWVLMAEVITPEVKASASGFIGSASWLIGFALMKSYQTLVDTINFSNLFLVYSLALFISMIGAICVIPNTKGKTLNDIQIAMRQ